MSEARKTPIEQFREAIAQNGMVPPETIITDGEYHRFSSSGKPKGTSGWYVYNTSYVPRGAFGDSRTGRDYKWKADIGYEMSAKESGEFLREQDRLRAQQKADAHKRHEAAKIRASDILDSSNLATDAHPYLVKKGVKAYGLTVWNDPIITLKYSKKNKPFLQITSPHNKAQFAIGVDLEGKTEAEACDAWKSTLIIPMLGENGQIQSLQFISKNGDKKFLSGGKMQGSYYPLGDLKGAGIILIAEGYATAATIHEATGLPVVVAYNAGNLLPVAETIRALYPEAGTILCADDDVATKGNPGVTAANEAAQAVDGKVIIPDFGANRPEGANDFNDMAAHLGKEAVSLFFQSYLNPEAAPKATTVVIETPKVSEKPPVITPVVVQAPRIIPVAVAAPEPIAVENVQQRSGFGSKVAAMAVNIADIKFFADIYKSLKPDQALRLNNEANKVTANRGNTQAFRQLMLLGHYLQTSGLESQATDHFNEARQLAAAADTAEKNRILEKAAERRSRISFPKASTHARQICTAPEQIDQRYALAVQRFEEKGHKVVHMTDKTLVHDKEGEVAFEVMPDKGIYVLTQDEMLIKDMLLEALIIGRGSIEATGNDAFKAQIKVLASYLGNELAAAGIVQPATINGEQIQMNVMPAIPKGSFRPQSRKLETAGVH